MSNEKQIHTEVVDIDDLIQDDHNFNRGTEEGAELIGRSFKEHGAGRSVFIDKNNRLVGGNKAQIGFKGAGYRKVVIVDSDPDTLVAVRRKDVDLDTKEGREMALLDNLTTERNLSWDPEEFSAVEVEGFDPSEYGFEVPEFDDGTNTPPADGEGAEGNATPKDNYNIIYSLVFNNEQEQETWFKFLRKLKARHPDMETISERVIHYITNSEIWQE